MGSFQVNAQVSLELTNYMLILQKILKKKKKKCKHTDFTNGLDILVKPGQVLYVHNLQL